MQTTSRSPTLTWTRLCFAALMLPHFATIASGESAQHGSLVVVSSPQQPTPLSPILKHSWSLLPSALHRRNAATSSGSANDVAVTAWSFIHHHRADIVWRKLFLLRC